MKNNNKHFTDIQIQLLKGNYTLIANKHEVSGSYVSKIANGKREVNTGKAVRVLESLKEKLLEFKSELA